MELTIESSAFSSNAYIPQKYTCMGEDISPPLSWSGTPPQARSYVLIVDDPDAPLGTWDHWILFNIPSSVAQLAEGAPLPQGAASGKNGWRTSGYRGPCPPSGTHRYFFKLYALDTQLNLDSSANKQAVTKAMQGHIIAQAELIGLFKK